MELVKSVEKRLLCHHLVVNNYVRGVLSKKSQLFHSVKILEFLTFSFIPIGLNSDSCYEDLGHSDL